MGGAKAVLRAPGTVQSFWVTHKRAPGAAWGHPDGVLRQRAPSEFPPQGPNHSHALHLLRNDCEKDAVTIALVNSMTSLYASIAVFSVLGFKAANDYGHCLDR